jgi:hypothetical protein
LQRARLARDAFCFCAFQLVRTLLLSPVVAAAVAAGPPAVLPNTPKRKKPHQAALSEFD